MVEALPQSTSSNLNNSSNYKASAMNNLFGNQNALPAHRMHQNIKYTDYEIQKRENQKLIKQEIEKFTDKMLDIINFGVKKNNRVPINSSNGSGKPAPIYALNTAAENYNFSRSNNIRYSQNESPNIG